MADRLEGMAWANIIRIQSENDRLFAKYVLEARSGFLTLRLRKDAAIRKIYVDAADRVAEELKGWLPEHGKLRQAHLKALEKGLRAEAERIQRALEAQVKDGVQRAVELGSDPLRRQLGRCLEEAGAKFSWLKLQRGFADVNARAVETFWARTRKGIFLSDRIWLESEKARKAIQTVVQDGIARGLDAVKIAQSVEQYLKVKTPVTEFKKMMERMGRLRLPRNLSYEALRMARTEIQIAHMEGLYAAGKVTPGYIGIVWYLSAGHPFRDECDDLAEADLYGMGAGVYPAGEEPIIPHPNCICFVVPKVEPTDKFVSRVKQWVQDPGSQSDLNVWYNNIYGGLVGRALPSLPSVLAPVVTPPPQPTPGPAMPLGTEKNPILVENVREISTGVSKTYEGTIGGKKYVFKADKPIEALDMLRGNLEAELLADKVFNHLGLPAPRTDYGWFDLGFGPERMLRTEFVHANTPRDFMARFTSWRAGLAQIDQDLFQRMQVIDVLIGNGDRHEGNFFLDDAGRVIPIDHNLAFGTDLVIRPPYVFHKFFTEDVGSVRWIVNRNPIGRDILKARGGDSYTSIIKDIQRKLTDTDIAAVVSRLPDELAEPARKEELVRILKWRRDHLNDLFAAL